MAAESGGETGPARRGGPPTVSVIITVLRDPRIARTIESLLAQRRTPEEIIVDDGGGGDEVRRIAEAFARRDRRVRYLLAPGNIAESRNAALAVATGEIVAFLDADEIAPPEWLERLLAPFSDPTVGFAGGPTPAMPDSLRNRTARFYDGYLRRLYDRVARTTPHALPMGNSAWRADLFRRLGPLETFGGRRVGNEDLDIAARALRAGDRGVYVPSAFVLHDFSDITLASLWRKQRSYAEGGYSVWRNAGVTYEASALRVLPYLALPMGAAVGGLLLLDPSTRWLGAIFVLVGAGLLGLLAVGLTIAGVRLEGTYPGLRYGALEILRRWATLYGAFRGAVRRSAGRRPDARDTPTIVRAGKR